MSRKESRKDAIGREIFQLCCFFFVFHGLFLTILFTSSSGHHHCKKWWIPSACPPAPLLSFVFLVQVKLEVLESGAAVAEGPDGRPGPDAVHPGVEDEGGQFRFEQRAAERQEIEELERGDQVEAAHLVLAL
ncbi:UNVERIFIED_CONTAM: hypothetical protein Slati_2044200 [Sesamum latifolium]|uniref:Uncharacterized protein n=1 Tax=Sesamum latifolium TaxID=2727402 RepID=A0AAW2WNG4_9LAMI